MIDPQNACSIVTQKPGPHVVAQGNVGHLRHDPLEGKSHRKVAPVDQSIGTATVRIVDHRFWVVTRREGTRRVMEIRPFHHQLYGQVRPRLGPVSQYEGQLGEVVEHLLDEFNMLTGTRNPWTSDASRHKDRESELDAHRIDRIHEPVIDGDLRREARWKEGESPEPVGGIGRSNLANGLNSLIGIWSE